MSLRIARAALGMSMIVGVLAGPAQAQQPYPNRPIRMLVGFAAGGVTDLLARAVGEELNKSLGQPVVVENRPGANAMIAAKALASALPDGYTLLTAAGAALTINVHMNPKPAYDTLKDFQPLSLLIINEGILVAGSDVPVKTLDDFLKLVRANPGKYSFGVSGVGSPTQMGPELLKKAAKLELTSVPYKGEVPILSDLLNGALPFAAVTIPFIKEQIKAGKVRPLAILGPNRYPDMPDVPTIAEAGYPEGFVQTWIGVLAPAGLPPDIAAKLTDALRKAMASPEVVKLMTAQSSRIVATSSEEFSNHIRSEMAKWGEVVKSLSLGGG